jgi:beta-lactamase class A
MFFRASEQKLGEGAKLGVKFYLLGSDGSTLTESDYHSDVMLPMASTKKIAIALAVLKRVFEVKDVNLDTVINIINSQFSAGRPTNTLDRYFFVPWEVTDKRTVNQLLTYMLTESDNSSTDVLLELAGGIDKVNQLMQDLNLFKHNLSFSSKTLLANYFGTTTDKSFYNICKTLHEFLSAYSLRPTEASMVQSESDACTPKMIADLLKLMVFEKTKEGSWIGKAVDVIFDKMEHCLTGNTVIKEGAKDFLPYAKSFGSKQGGLGGIRNDSAFLHLNDGRWVILSIHTCLSSLPLASRDAVIADLSKSLLIKYCDLPLRMASNENAPLLSGIKM